jgi:hypothetical protein
LPTRIDVNETREQLQDKLLEMVDGGSVKTAGYISDVVRGLGRVAVLNRACYGSQRHQLEICSAPHWEAWKLHPVSGGP